MHQQSSCIIAPAALAFAVAWGLPARAKPVAPLEFCRIYPQTALCASGAAPCTTCHTTPPARNAYGMQVASALSPGTPRPLSDEQYLSGLPAALRAAESLDADSDGTSNLEEFQAGTLHVDATSLPSRIVGCDPEQRALASAQPWNTCAYDPAYALTRIGLDFCGQSPTRGELEAVRGMSDWQMLLEQKLASCLDSAFWQGKDGVLWNLANAKILPESSLKSGDGAADITLADYEDDYNLFVYINTDDRDVRELLTAKYHAIRQPDGALVRVDRTPVEDILARESDDNEDVAQLVPQDRRAGMLTTRWFLAKNTMFTPVPRTTAAQAYRAYLGYDIAKLEGLQPVAGEPVDYDRKGVTAEQCAVCHSTLDPLSYPFSRYDGIGGGDEEDDEEDFLNPDMEMDRVQRGRHGQWHVRRITHPGAWSASCDRRGRRSSKRQRLACSSGSPSQTWWSGPRSRQIANPSLAKSFSTTGGCWSAKTHSPAMKPSSRRSCSACHRSMNTESSACLPT